MTSLVCLVCKKYLNKRIWDNHTHRIYCAQFIPLLPRGEQMSSSVQIKSGSGPKTESKEQRQEKDCFDGRTRAN